MAEEVLAVGGAHQTMTEAQQKSDAQDKFKREAHALRQKLKRNVVSCRSVLQRCTACKNERKQIRS